MRILCADRQSEAEGRKSTVGLHTRNTSEGVISAQTLGTKAKGFQRMVDVIFE